MYLSSRLLGKIICKGVFGPRIFSQKKNNFKFGYPFLLCKFWKIYICALSLNFKIWNTSKNRYSFKYIANVTSSCNFPLTVWTYIPNDATKRKNNGTKFCHTHYNADNGQFMLPIRTFPRSYTLSRTFSQLHTCTSNSTLSIPIIVYGVVTVTVFHWTLRTVHF